LRVGGGGKGGAMALCAAKRFAPEGAAGVSETLVNDSPSTPSGHLVFWKKRADRKNGPILVRFGRKTGVWRGQKNIFFCLFSRFSGFSLLQVVGRQILPPNLRVQKKSCQKTYRRFLVFEGLW
jgi:hypothetical protein